MDIVGSNNFFPETHRRHNYIVTMIDCFTRIAVSVPIVDQFFFVFISVIIGNYHTE